MFKFIYLSVLLLSIPFTSLAQSEQTDLLLEETKTPSLVEPLLFPFKATYSILHKSKKVGTAIRELEKLTDNTYRYSYTTDIEWLIFDDKRTEESIVTLSKNNVIPQHYKYIREGTGRDKFYEWSYDIANN